MQYKGLVKGSKTMDFAALLAVFGTIEQNLPMVKDMIGDNYGLVFIGVSVIVALLRMVTTKPLGDDA